MTRPRFSPASDRGATVIEYALLVALVAVISSSAIQFLGESIYDSFDETTADIQTDGGPDGLAGPTPTGPPAPPTSPPTAPPPTAPPTTVTPTTVTPTTATPTTPPPTAPPTTATPTTPPPTAPPPTAPPVGSGWTATSSTLQNPNNWKASATVSIYGTDGKLLTAVNAAVQITVTQTYRTWDGKLATRSWTTQGNLVNGMATFSDSGLATAKPNKESIVSMTYAVTGVVYYWPTNPPVKWDGGKPTVTILAP